MGCGSTSTIRNFVWFDLLALAHLSTGDVREAVETATQALKIRPHCRLALDIMTICYTAAARLDEARPCFAAARRASLTIGETAYVRMIMIATSRRIATDGAETGSIRFPR